MKNSAPTRTRKQKILLAFILLITAASVFGFTKGIHYGPDTDLSLARHYRTIGECPGIGISNAKLKTKLVDDKLLYMLNLTVAKGKQKNLPASFTVRLLDKDGFDIQYFTINASYFTEELDNLGKPVGYSYQSTQFMDADKYKSVAGWSLVWVLN